MRRSEREALRVAKACHEAVRAVNRGYGDMSMPTWEDAPTWQRQITIEAVQFWQKNPTAEPSSFHTAWMKLMADQGYVWGEKQCHQARTHPGLVAFEFLPIKIQVASRVTAAIAIALIPEKN